MFMAFVIVTGEIGIKSAFETMLYLYREFSYYREFEASYDGVCKRIGNDCLFEEYIDPDKIISCTARELSAYKKKAAAYLMY